MQGCGPAFLFMPRYAQSKRFLAWENASATVKIETSIMSEFTHLHLHSHFSLLDGACEPEKLVARVKEQGMKSVAMTDHGNIFGAWHFYHAAKSAGIRPIIGCELYVCKKDDHRGPPEGDKYNQ